MVGVARENPQTYAAGALLANGARLTEIHPKYVVLEREGHSTKLYLEGSGLTAGNAAASKSLLTVGGRSAPEPSATPTTEPLTDYLRPTPIYEGETLLGYQVYPGAKSGAFAQMGLQAGDVITRIDGAPLSDPAQATEALRGLLDGRAHPASLKRQGSAIEVSLDGSVISKDQDQQHDVTSVVPEVTPIS